MDKLFKEVSVKKLYKDCLLLARFYGQRVRGVARSLGSQRSQPPTCDPMPRPQQGNEKVLVNTVRAQFKANMREVDDDKVNLTGH